MDAGVLKVKFFKHALNPENRYIQRCRGRLFNIWRYLVKKNSPVKIPEGYNTLNLH